MLLSVFSPVLASSSLDESLKYLSSLGVDAMELGCGGFPGTAHVDVLQMDKNPAKLKEVKDLFEKYNIKIAALSVHGNGVHPDKKVADKSTQELEAAFSCANKLGVDRVVTFSGCPGDGSSKSPNWVTCTWPNDYTDLLAWQWGEVLVPYWKKQAILANQAGVKVALEMHPGFCVYNVETMLRLRAATDKAIGANLDPSHLIWQGCDIVSVIKVLSDAIHFFHAKDTMFNTDMTNINGVLDTKPYTNEASRSWLFRTVGYGAADWKAIVTALRMVGYDYAMSIEHEDSLMTPKEGLEKAVKHLKEVMIKDGSKTAAWWV